MPVSGTKKVQIDRLFANPLTSDYGDEKVGYTGDGKTVDDLKADCRSAGLVVGGVKYDLVMRLIKHNAAGIEAEPTPAAVKRAVALAKAREAQASPAAGGKRKVVNESKAAGKKRPAPDAWCESDGDEDDEDDEDDEEEDEYEVLSIVSSRKAKGGQTEYLVRWRGYEAEEDNTWEPA